MNSLPDWKLPSGTSRGTWAYLTDADLARTYDERLSGTGLLQYDLRFAEHFFPGAGSLIDLGCGTGRLLLPFARRGYAALGVDLSAEMLKVAHQKLAAAGLSVPLIRANLVELDGLRDQSFDYAACLFSTLGMVRGRANRRQVLQHVRRVLKPGGRFLLHVHNLWFHLGTRLGRRWLLRDGLRQLGRADDAGDFEMPPHEGIAGLSLHHYARREVLRELRAAGFRIQIVQPIDTRPDAQLRRPWFLSGVRAYGFLIGAERP